MAYQTITEYNATEITDVFVYTATVVPILIPLVLFAFFIIMLLGSFFAQKRLSGTSDFFASFAVAGYSTFVVSIVLSLADNLISTYIVVITLIVAVVGTVMLLLTRE